MNELELGPETEARLERLVAAVVEHPHAPTAIRTEADARERHIADSLSALAVDELHDARRIADLGSGAGFPGLVLAAALLDAEVELIEAAARKGAVAAQLAAAAGIANVHTVDQRSEEWARGLGRERYEVVTARAVGSLAELCELASPLLARDGLLIAWKGSRDPGAEDAARAGAGLTAMTEVEVLPVTPFAGSRDRHLHLYRKIGRTPQNLPRRPGKAHKRALGA